MNCKQGDLAIVVRANNPENIGKIVEVLRPSPLDEGFRSLCGKWRVSLHMDVWTPATWVVRSQGSPITWRRTKQFGAMYLFDEAPFNDAQLRPIPKLDEPESTTTKKELTV